MAGVRALVCLQKDATPVDYAELLADAEFVGGGADQYFEEGDHVAFRLGNSQADHGPDRCVMDL